MMSWKKLRWSWRGGWSGTRKSLVKSRSGPQLRNSANQSPNAKDAKVCAEDAEENFFATFAGTLAFFAFGSWLDFAACCLLPNAFRTHALPHGRATAPRALAKSNCYATGRSISVTFTAAFTFANTAAESASMGSGDLVSRAAL